METEALNLLKEQLKVVLNNALPKISASWWHTLVINKLTFQQQSMVATVASCWNGLQSASDFV
jgi:hypothetical protein